MEIIIRTEFYVPGARNAAHAIGAESVDEFSSPFKATATLLSLMSLGDAAELGRFSGMEDWAILACKAWIEDQINARKDFELTRQIGDGGACLNIKVLYWNG